MGNIVLLDDLTINKIAAGEVIERPASVVKELVENSIDAGATNIVVEVKNGGISFIRITDNGKGVMPDDMEIAFERHATSKIRNASDLATVKSMGFRGEALASIAAIAKVTLKSKTQDTYIGNCITVEGGKILGIEETACPQGTVITVENLFYNTPVRYKFLKKDFTEAGYIEDCITRIALVNPHIAIKLISGGKTIIQTTGNGELKDVIYNIYGRDVAENIIKVNSNYEDIEIEGVVGKPVIARSNRSNQIFFVNNRYVKDKTLTAATEKAFKGLLTIGKFGFLVLNIKMNPEQVDSNVHPAKLEVRFQDESKIFKAVYHAIKDNLLTANLVSNPNEKTGDNEDGLIRRKNTEKIEELYNTIRNKKLNYNEIKNILAQSKEENETKMEESSDNVENESKDKVQELFEKAKNKADSSNIIEELFNERQNKNEQMEEKNNEQVNISDNVETNYTKEENSVNEISDKKGLNEENKNEKEIEKENVKIEDISVENIEETNIENIKTKKEEVGKENVLQKLIHKLQASGITVENAEEVENKEKQKYDEKDNNDTLENMEKNIENMNLEDENLDKEQKKEEVSYEEFEKMYREMFGVEKKKEEKIEEAKDENYETEILEDAGLFDSKNPQKVSHYKYIGIVFSTYIILEIDNEMYIIDQHAAHERIMYEKIKENYYSDENKDTQIMLLPDIIDLTHKEKMIIQENVDLFEKAGFMLEEFGESTIKLIGVPNICIDLDTKELFLETLDEINTVAKTAKDEIEDKFIATIACKAAVKANMALDEEEVKSLLDDLLKLDNPFTCPHGRPTAIKMSKIEIEKKFSRRK